MYRVGANELMSKEFVCFFCPLTSNDLAEFLQRSRRNSGKSYRVESVSNDVGNNFVRWGIADRISFFFQVMSLKRLSIAAILEVVVALLISSIGESQRGRREGDGTEKCHANLRRVMTPCDNLMTNYDKIRRFVHVT